VHAPDGSGAKIAGMLAFHTGTPEEARLLQGCAPRTPGTASAAREWLNALALLTRAFVPS